MIGSVQAVLFLQLIVLVLLTGYFLFWAIMTLSLARVCDRDERRHHLEIVKTTRWPHVVIPWRFRLPWPVIGWLFITVAFLIALVLLPLDPVQRWSTLTILKLLLLLFLAGLHHRLVNRPAQLVAAAGLVTVLAVVSISSLAVR